MIDSSLELSSDDGAVAVGPVLNNCLSLAGRAGGTLLVVESEKTRWHYAARLVSDLENSGARVLGTVLSNRRYHIPKFLYRRL